MAGASGHNNRRWRLSGRKPLHVDGVRNDINVTPLVDVMLVLLILFMLMTLIMGRGHEVAVPEAKNFSEEKDKMQPVVSVDVGGNLYVEKTKIGQMTADPAVNLSLFKEMDQRIHAVWADPKKPDAHDRVYLKAATMADYGKIYPVLEYLNKQMGLASVDLAVGQPPEKK
jgi:biopolymer transport protein ExbD